MEQLRRVVPTFLAADFTDHLLTNTQNATTYHNYPLVFTLDLGLIWGPPDVSPENLQLSLAKASRKALVDEPTSYCNTRRQKR